MLPTATKVALSVFSRVLVEPARRRVGMSSHASQLEQALDRRRRDETGTAGGGDELLEANVSFVHLPERSIASLRDDQCKGGDNILGPSR